jgi:excisionase family DNA binding protein
MERRWRGQRGEVPRLALTKAEAAEALGVSVDFLEQHVMPELRVVRRGRRRLIALRELEQWLQQSGEAVPLPADLTGLRF